jgi:hypothetical protein
MGISSKYFIQIGTLTQYRAQHCGIKYGTYFSKYSTQNRRYCQLTQNKEERVKQIRTPDYSVLNLSAAYIWSLPVGYVIPWHWLSHQIVRTQSAVHSQLRP